MKTDLFCLNAIFYKKKTGNVKPKILYKKNRDYKKKTGMLGSCVGQCSMQCVMVCCYLVLHSQCSCTERVLGLYVHVVMFFPRSLSNIKFKNLFIINIFPRYKKRS